jgi:hypothetical protein
MAAWPVSLPQSPLVNGYDEQFPKMGLRSSMDAGPAKQRRRSTAAVTPISIRLALTNAQVETLLTFWKTDTGGGVLSFTWVHPRTGTAVTMRFIADQPPHPQPLDSEDLYSVSFPLEILP